jgi:putative membrane protein
MKSSSVLVLSTVALIGSLVFTSKSVAQQPPSDANIGAIVLAANQIDIDYGKLALSKSKNKEVLGFAQQMVTDHGAVQKSVIDLAGKLRLTPVENDTSNNLKAKSVEVMAKLKSLQGKAFDKYYVDNEVTYHKLVTDVIAGVLIPSAQNSELKAALQGAQTLFLGHLEHARNVQAIVDHAAAHDTGRPVRECNLQLQH